MKLIRSITEDEMIAIFLRGEFTSERFGDAIHEQLVSRNLSESVVTNPDLSNATQNKARRNILSTTRGYEQRTEVFGGFPHDVKWVEAELTKDELAQVRYIDYSYWVELTDGTRLPKDAAINIEAGKEVFNVSNDRFKRAAQMVRADKQFPAMILVGEDEYNLVALEGHLRLTAYALAGDKTPDKIKVVIGTSPNMKEWHLY